MTYGYAEDDYEKSKEYPEIGARRGTLSKREIVLNHPEKETRSMALPKGKYCQDCRGFLQCLAYIGIEPLNEVCDFYPNRFTEFVYDNQKPNKE